jgi:hypothetical protein
MVREGRGRGAAGGGRRAAGEFGGSPHHTTAKDWYVDDNRVKVGGVCMYDIYSRCRHDLGGGGVAGSRLSSSTFPSLLKEGVRLKGGVVLRLVSGIGEFTFSFFLFSCCVSAACTEQMVEWWSNYAVSAKRRFGESLRHARVRLEGR